MNEHRFAGWNPFDDSHIKNKENKMSKEKSDTPSLNYHEPGSNKPVEIDFHEPNEIYDEKYIVVIKNISDNKRIAIRIPYTVLHIALHQGWGEE